MARGLARALAFLLGLPLAAALAGALPVDEPPGGLEPALGGSYVSSHFEAERLGFSGFMIRMLMFKLYLPQNTHAREHLQLTY